jgi:hypothetical protein
MVGDELQKSGGWQYFFTAEEVGLYKHSTFLTVQVTCSLLIFD